MPYPDAIGGYFGLEPTFGELPYSAGLLLNSGRNCFAYLLDCLTPTKVWLSKYTCDVMLEPLRARGVTYDFYSIDENLEIMESFTPLVSELVVYVNYFGLKSGYCQKLASAYGPQLVLDCSQAWYFDARTHASSSHVFYSPRKFFGLPDGGILLSDTAPDTTHIERDITSSMRSQHLLLRIERSAEDGFAAFRNDDGSLTGQPVKGMSKLTERLLRGADHEASRKKRNDNFSYLAEHLGVKNDLEFWDAYDGPMVYPFSNGDTGVRRRLLDNRIYAATYWPNVLKWAKAGEVEYRLTNNLLALPVDQRYDQSDMDRIIGVINEG